MELPDFLKVSVERGLIDEQIARRIELFRRTRGLGESALVSTLLTSNVDPHLTFKNFVQCKENSFAFELAMKCGGEATFGAAVQSALHLRGCGLGQDTYSVRDSEYLRAARCDHGEHCGS